MFTYILFVIIGGIIAGFFGIKEYRKNPMNTLGIIYLGMFLGAILGIHVELLSKDM